MSLHLAMFHVHLKNTNFNDEVTINIVPDKEKLLQIYYLFEPHMYKSQWLNSLNRVAINVVSDEGKVTFYQFEPALKVNHYPCWRESHILSVWASFEGKSLPMCIIGCLYKLTNVDNSKTTDLCSSFLSLWSSVYLPKQFNVFVYVSVTHN